jgi:phosphate:Na+ symporter
MTDIALPMLLGFAVFMSGMKLMELALHRLGGGRIAAVLEKATATPLHGLLSGTAITAALQSSTAVTVMTIGLVNAGLITFPRTLGIILGTNIGTCLTTELIGLSLNRSAIPLMAVSVLGWLASVLLHEANPRRDPASPAPGWHTPLRFGSLASFGFGLLLLGMTVMQSIAPAVEESRMFALFLDRADESVLWGIAAGAALTAAVHSSAAVIGMMMGLAAFGAMPVEIGIAAVLGANVGTCFTAVLAAAGGSPGGRFVAWAHLLLNVGGCVLFAPMVDLLALASGWISASPAAQIAHAQTIFNIVCSILALPLCYLPVWNRPARPPVDDRLAA